MPIRSGEAVWKGNLAGGKGTMKFGSGAFEGPYSFSSRFEEGKGSNPEELIGAAHAGCFSMAFAGNLAKAGGKPESIHTTARVHLDKFPDGFKITRIDLVTEAKVAGLDAAAVQEQAQAAKKGCPVSQALAGVDIRLELKLL